MYNNWGFLSYLLTSSGVHVLVPGESGGGDHVLAGLADAGGFLKKAVPLQNSRELLFSHENLMRFS